MILVTFFHWFMDNLNPKGEKNRVSSFGEKPILRFLPYIARAIMIGEITKGSIFKRD